MSGNEENTPRNSPGVADRLKVLRGLGLPESMAVLEAVRLHQGKRRTSRDQCILSFVQNIKIDPSGCWIWTGSPHDKDGYGSASFLGKNWLAHRLSFLIASGSDPGYGHVCHHCDNPPCVNPDHLYLGSPETNGRDKSLRNRVNAPFGQSHGRAKITESQALQILESYKPHIKTVPMLVDETGLSYGAVEKIIYGQNWKHLKSGLRGVPKVPSPI